MSTSIRAALAALLVLSVSCAQTPAPPPAAPPAAGPVFASDEALLDDVQRRTFLWFWETSNAENGLVNDRWPTQSFCSVAAVGLLAGALSGC